MKKKVFLGIMLCAIIIECSIFFYYYFFGEHGYTKIAELQRQQDMSNQAVHDLKCAVVDLEKQLHDFKKFPYFKEKIIREQLQMIKPDEVIYKQV